MSNGDRALGAALLKMEEEAAAPKLRAIGLEAFLEEVFPPREIIVGPIVQSKGVSMIHGARGLGKTFFVMSLAIARVSGGRFLKWDVPKPGGVLYIDGEMPAVVIQDRFIQIIIGADAEPVAPLNILSDDLQEFGMPDLSTQSGQDAIEPHLEGVDLVIVDNLSTLCRTGNENSADDWVPVQSWALKLRRRGISCIFVHHTGKTGLQRGTSRREDILDTVIALRKPVDYSPDDGAHFEVHFDKCRGFYGDDVKPLDVTLRGDGRGGLQWAIKDLEQTTTEKVADLLNEGIPQKEIHEMLNITKGAVSKAKKRAKAMGLLK